MSTTLALEVEVRPDVQTVDLQLVNSLRDSAQIADTCLLDLAVCRQGRLASFDQWLVTPAVAGGSKALELIPA